jgi:hypothetical protein
LVSIDTTRRIRMRIEQVFGWTKVYGGLRKTRLRGVARNPDRRVPGRRDDHLVRIVNSRRRVAQAPREIAWPRSRSDRRPRSGTGTGAGRQNAASPRSAAACGVEVPALAPPGIPGALGARTMHHTRCLLFTIPILAGACAIEPIDDIDDVDELEELETAVQPLDGTWTTVNCTASEQTMIAGALDLIEQRLDSSEYLECVQSAYLIERYGVIVEDVVATLQEKPTTINCVAAGACGGSAVACAGVPEFGDDVPETMSVERDYLATASAASLARTIVHEAVHTHGWNHYPNSSDLAYPWSLPGQFGSCMSNLDPDGWSRSDPYGDAELTPVGGEGGQPFHLRCPSGQRATGITVDSSSYVNRIRLRCSGGSQTGVAGEYKDSTSTITHDCPAGASLVGFAGRSTSIVRYLRAYCASNTDLDNDVDPLPTTSRFLGGSYTGTLASRMCPIGMAVVGAVGRSGARIDQVRWLCSDYDGAVLANPHPHGYRGTKAGNSKLEMCGGRGAIRALYGHAGGEVDQLGAECYPTITDAVTGLPSASEGNTRRHGLDFNGGTGGPVFSKPCPAGMLMVGLRFRSGARIDAIGGLCADPEAWASGNTATTNVSLSGGNTGTYSTLTCPSREFLVGLQTWAAYTPQHATTTVHGVAPMCRRLDV